MLIKLLIWPIKQLLKNSIQFIKLQRSLFTSRRKTVKNNLTIYLSNSELAEKALNKAGINPTERAENLPIEKILLLSDQLNTDILKA